MSRTSERADPGTLARLTERGLHAQLRRWLPAGRQGWLPLGDDCAALPLGPDRALLLTTDAVVEGTHFPPGAPAQAVGRYAAAVNLSDLAAKGGEPRALLASTILPPRTPVTWVRRALTALDRFGREYGAPLVGGDTKAGSVRALSVTAVGEAPRRRLQPRTAARAGDLLVSTGTVGRGGARFTTWSHEPTTAHLSRLLDVRPRIVEGRLLGPFSHATADTSDGLAVAARGLAEASRLTLEVDLTLVPWDPEVHVAARRWGRPVAEVGTLGGDFELLTVVPPTRWAAAQRAVERSGGTLAVIGRCRRGAPTVRWVGPGWHPTPSTGWDAFAPRPRT